MRPVKAGDEFLRNATQPVDIDGKSSGCTIINSDPADMSL
jgi:hypothetical protein